MNNLLTNRQWNIEGTWYAPEKYLQQYKSVIKTGYITMSSSAGDWAGMFVQKLNGWYYFIPFSQENNYPRRSGFTLYTDEVFAKTSVISEEVWEEMIKEFIEIYY